MRLCITGGGTGGHLAIAAALAQAARDMGIETVFIGSTSGQDQKYFKDSPLFDETYFLSTSGVVNKRGVAKVRALLNIFKAGLQAARILKRKKIDATISVGGFSAAPASFATLLLGKALFIHEQNARTGRLNELLRPFCKGFFSSYDADSPVKEYPVMDIFFELARTRKEVKSVIFLGGSQGAHAINELALKTAPYLSEHGIHIIHQSGEREYERVAKAYETMGINAEHFAFSKELAHKMHKADLAISRSGASTLWELAANGLPALFIPYPYAAGDHQFYNAKFLADEGLAWIKRESEDPQKGLMRLLDMDLQKISEALRKKSARGAARKILMHIQKVLQK